MSEKNCTSKTRVCLNGHKVIEPDLSYCPICGMPISSIQDGIQQDKVCISYSNTWNNGNKHCRHCGTLIDQPGFCPICGMPISSMQDGIQQDKVCKNCSNTWNDGDKYCRYCGAPMDHPGFKVQEFHTIYGPPPVKRIHTCKMCNYKWETDLMIDRELYCPECGNRVVIEEVEDEYIRKSAKLLNDLPPDNKFKSTSGWLQRLRKKAKR